MPKIKKNSFPKRFLKYCFKLFLKLLVIVILLTMVQVAVLRYVNPPCTVAMACNWIKGKVTSKPYTRPKYDWRPLKEMSPWLIKAVLAAEDQRFMSHHGFDFNEMNRAVRDIMRDGRVRGASTITMQLSRTTFLWQDRTLLRKTAEAYYTILVEIFLTKVRILEIYLNVVDWGTGVMGAEAASQKYFHTSSAKVTPSQAALMAAILPSPHKWSPVNPNSQVKQRRKRILKEMGNMHL